MTYDQTQTGRNQQRVNYSGTMSRERISQCLSQNLRYNRRKLVLESALVGSLSSRSSDASVAEWTTISRQVIDHCVGVMPHGDRNEEETYDALPFIIAVSFKTDCRRHGAYYYGHRVIARHPTT